MVVVWTWCLDMVAGSYVAKEVQCLAEDGRLVIIAVQGGVQSEINAGLVMRKRLTITGSTLRARPVAFKAAIAPACLHKVWPCWQRDASSRWCTACSCRDAASQWQWRRRPMR